MQPELSKEGINQMSQIYKKIAAEINIFSDQNKNLSYEEGKTLLKELVRSKNKLKEQGNLK